MTKVAAVTETTAAAVMTVVVETKAVAAMIAAIKAEMIVGIKMTAVAGTVAVAKKTAVAKMIAAAVMPTVVTSAAAVMTVVGITTAVGMIAAATTHPDHHLPPGTLLTGVDPALAAVHPKGASPPEGPRLVITAGPEKMTIPIKTVVVTNTETPRAIFVARAEASSVP